MWQIYKAAWSALVVPPKPPCIGSRNVVLLEKLGRGVATSYSWSFLFVKLAKSVPVMPRDSTTDVNTIIVDVN